MKTPALIQDHALLLAWYRRQRRDLPWRMNRDPYRIWISEVMLQQTTVVAVIPYYERFLEKFPSVQTLAAAPESAVLTAWAGLGYYSRARNLHKASKVLAEKGFPKTAAELIEFPGFGPYTSAAVASIAFGDPVGVLDGNVIRVLSRKEGFDTAWWTTTARRELQQIATAYAQTGQPDEINQALMELGATVCTPQSPTCLLCPWNQTCVAFQTGKVQSLPRPKPRKKRELWTWSPRVHFKQSLSALQVALVQTSTSPVLRGQWIFPGTFEKVEKKPQTFHARHGITHHDLYVHVKRPPQLPPGLEVHWVDVDKVVEMNPSKLLQKVLDAAHHLRTEDSTS